MKYLVVLNEAPLALQFEIIRTGRLLYESSRNKRTDAEDRIVRDYLDVEPLLGRSFRDIAEEAGGRARRFNKQLAANRTQTARNALDLLERLSSMSLGEFKGDPDNYGIAEHHLRRALEALLDVGRHVVVKSSWGNPSKYREIFDFLEQGKVLSANLAQRGRELFSYRDRLVHEYCEVTCEELWDVLQSRLSDIRDLLAAVLRHISNPKQPSSAQQDR